MGIGIRTSVVRDRWELVSGPLCLGIDGNWYQDLCAYGFVVVAIRTSVHLPAWFLITLRSYITLENGTDRSSGNIWNQPQNEGCVTSQKSEGLNYAPASAWNTVYLSRYVHQNSFSILYVRECRMDECIWKINSRGCNFKRTYFCKAQALRS